jgi:hypothetical protein
MNLYSIGRNNIISECLPTVSTNRQKYAGKKNSASCCQRLAESLKIHKHADKKTLRVCTAYMRMKFYAHTYEILCTYFHFSPCAYVSLAQGYTYILPSGLFVY